MGLWEFVVVDPWKRFLKDGTVGPWPPDEPPTQEDMINPPGKDENAYLRLNDQTLAKIVAPETRRST